MCVFTVSTCTVQKPSTPCPSLRSPCGPSRQLRKLGTPCASLLSPCGPSEHTMREDTRADSALCVGSHTNNPCVLPSGKTWSSTRCAQPECEVRGRRARPGCGGERGRGTCGPCRRAPLHCGPTPPSERVRHTPLSHPSRIQIHHCQTRRNMCRGLWWACGVGIMHVSYAACTRYVWIECISLLFFPPRPTLSSF